ncbi:MAG: histidine--tRNA ligase [Phycisphaerae bacterium]|jgi:histidyl-tRNA synthetase
MAKARLFRGLRDLLPAEADARRRVIDTIRNVYELYGFAPLETPAIEYLDALSGSGGDEIQESIFLVGNPDRRRDPGKEALGLRFDLTVPLARVVSQYKDLPRPFRRYQVSPVWRADKPDRGRFREFLQFDIDSVGAPSSEADVEIIAAACDSFAALDLNRFKVRFSSRRLLNLLLKFAEVPAEVTLNVRVKSGPGTYASSQVKRSGTDVFRVLDKLDRVGSDKVRLELTSGYTDESGDEIPGLGLAQNQVDRIDRFLSIASDQRQGVLDELYEVLGPVGGATEEIDIVARMSEQLALLGYGDDRVGIDLSVARGLAYYTGPVFEAVLLDAPEFGSVFGGGRYDDLVSRFQGESVPATGASIGVDRLLAALLHLGHLKQQNTPTRVLVTVFDRSLMDDYLTMTHELRRAGIPAEMYVGPGKKIGRQMKYADTLGIPVVVICGEDEIAKGRVTLKDMLKGRERSMEIADRSEWVSDRPGQFDVPRQDLVDAVRQMLG